MCYYIGVGLMTYDPLAQTVEHLTFNQGVRSSSLRWVTKKAEITNVISAFLIIYHRDTSSFGEAEEVCKYACILAGERSEP